LFEDRLNETFHLQGVNDVGVSLTLTEVGSPDEHILKQAHEQGIRSPFYLVFSGPLETFLEQHMYTLFHEELGKLDMFLVPVKQDEKAFYYEAVFG